MCVDVLARYKFSEAGVGPWEVNKASVVSVVSCISHTLHLEQVKKWHRYGGDSKALGTQCLECSEATSQGYPDLSWSQLLVKVRVNKAFAKEVSSVVKRWRQTMQASGSSQQTSGRLGRRQYATQDLDAERLEGYMLERIMMFISESEFLAQHQIAMKDVPELKPHIQELMENGKPIRGIAVQDPSHPHRLLHVFSSFQSMLTERIHAAAHQLRESQGEEAMEAFRCTHFKTLHPSLKGNTKLPDIGQIVEMHKKKVMEEQAPSPPSPLRQVWEEGAEERPEQKGLIDLDEQDDTDDQKGAPAFASTLAAGLGAKAANKKRKKDGASPQRDVRRRVAGKQPSSVATRSAVHGHTAVAAASSGPRAEGSEVCPGDSASAVAGLAKPSSVASGGCGSTGQSPKDWRVVTNMNLLAAGDWK